MKETKLKNYELIETDDGSTTLFSRLYNEACHSTSGARSETKLHYIDGCELEAKINASDVIRVLEVGFGTGLGFEETLQATKDKCFLEFVSFEIDRELVLHYLDTHNMSYESLDNSVMVKTKDYNLRILIGDARETIKTLQDFKADAIYQDAFSPKRNAILWTKQWFSELYNIADKNCIMSTYSASSSIRKAMIAAGWKVYSGVKFGPKRSSTRAKITGESELEILEKLERSPAILLTDENYQTYKL